ERLEPGTLNRAVMHETVLGAVVRCDEPKPLRIVEPLHLAGRTHSYSCVMIVAGERNTPDPSGQSVSRGIPRPPAGPIRQRGPEHPGPPGAASASKVRCPGLFGKRSTAGRASLPPQNGWSHQSTDWEPPDAPCTAASPAFPPDALSRQPLSPTGR